MPWKERSVMDERIRFVIRLKDGESMASLCREGLGNDHCCSPFSNPILARMR